MILSENALYIKYIRLKEAGDLPHEYPYTVPALAGFSGLRFRRPVTFIVGENGMGKSTLLEHRLRGNGLYIFDEPEAALSPSRQMYMLCRIKQLVESGSQFIVSTHSPIVMAYPGADIYEIADNGLQLTELEQTPHYLLMKRFCLDHEGMLRQLGFGIPES